MGRESRRDSCNRASSVDVTSTANTRDMIGEIENQSTHLLAPSHFNPPPNTNKIVIKIQFDQKPNPSFYKLVNRHLIVD
ncbi:hypothetical protein L1987_27749 [Smallanthus sonchifolius]|uniref:Uncharacterized protein n=1 Tax=Smallanthus sonchifolius TaxID=185202 RepID=A0ACB9IDD6_9ASTR|nr:hypothetical protein L1987_27749 [Smallanthus sonchifolius]